MIFQELQKEIISCIWSTDLKKCILENNYVFTEEELLGIAFHYSSTFEERLRLLKLLVDYAPSVSDHAFRCIKWQQKCMKEFCKHSDHEIYDLCIKEDQDAYEEHYMCASYDTALEMIDKYYQEYDFVEETEQARYTIKKRRILQPDQPFSEDIINQCIFGAGKVLLSVEAPVGETENGKCNQLCMECSNPSILNFEVNFPDFIPDRSAVKYCLPDGSVHYGIHLVFHKNNVTDSCYIIPLDSEMLKNKRYEEYGDGLHHEHIPCPYVESVPTTSLDPELRKNYDSFVAWLDTDDQLLPVYDILGKKLDHLGLACEMMMFSFGDFSLHAQCFTRIIKDNDVLVTTLDYQNWDGENDTNNDEWYFIEQYKDSIVGGQVISVEFSPVNDVVIKLNNGICIEVIIANGYHHYEDESEQWVFFKCQDHSYPFINVYNKSIDVVTEW